MFNFRNLFISCASICVLASAAFAADEQKIEAYAHPTMFGGEAQEQVDATEVYVVGGKITKATDRVNVIGKDNVLVDSFVKDVMSTLKNNAQGVFNPKMPILRSELAVVMVEGLSIDRTVNSKYKDIAAHYWAKSWIDRALASKVMIGYPDDTFKPDQPVTKAEVFATIATLMEVPTDRSLLAPKFKGETVRYIPNWAIQPAKVIVASQLLNDVPNPKKVINDEYLSKEQVAYLVGSLRQNYIFNYQNGVGKAYLKQYKPTCLSIALTERLSAKTSNIGDKFTAKTTKPVTIAGKSFPVGALVKGEVVEVSRPGFKRTGFIKVKFNEIVMDKCCVAFPKNISGAKAISMKNPNFVSRLFGLPFSAAGRTAGVAGRTGAATLNIAGNGAEKYGANISNTFVNTLSMQPKAGARALGASFVTVGKGACSLAKILASGTFGVVYEITDEVKYVIIPSSSNNSSLNPGEELLIIY